MNPTKKRLSIINLAISITDIETIQLQLLKLGLLKSDAKIQEIITVLQAENYAKAQRLIKAYIDTPMDEILQRASQQKALDEENKISEEDQKTIEEFELFTADYDKTSQQEKKQEIDINDYLTEVAQTPASDTETQSADFDALLNIKPNDVLPGNIEIDISQDPNDSFFNVSEKEERALNTDDVPKDTFFDVDDDEKSPEEKSSSNDLFDTLLTIKTDTKASLSEDTVRKKVETEKISKEKHVDKNASENEETVQEPVNTTNISIDKEFLQKPKIEEVPEEYPPISYIRQKFASMRKQYEPIQKGHERFPTVETFLTTISQDGYKEKEIEETLSYIERLVQEQKFAEAAQLLLVCASTESNFAQLMLARELYKGVLLRKKVAEAFSILTHMADDNYPEALCDLGQFYEFGISTPRDKKVAQELYKKAMDLGIKRAAKHYARMKKQNKGFFSKK